MSRQGCDRCGKPDHPLTKFELCDDCLGAVIHLEKRIKELEQALDDINTAMWESFMIKDRPFTDDDGHRIMRALESIC